MNDSNATDPIQAQEFSLKETQSLEDTPSGIGQKGNTLIIIGLVFLMVIIGAGAYFLGAKTNQVQTPNNTQPLPTSDVTQAQPTNGAIQTPQPTTTTSPQNENVNWKTYQDAKKGFSFKYPSNAQVSTGTVASMLSFQEDNGINVKPPYEAPYDKWYTMDLVVRDNLQGIDAKTIINNYIEEIKKTCSPPACGTPTMIQNTLKPYQNGAINGYIFHIGAETDSAMVVQVKGNKTYVFRMSGDQGYATDSGLKIFDQILSTFMLQ